MTTAEAEQHLDVGAYAIGVLDEVDTARFEEHLAGCDACAEELAALLPVAALLADAPTESFAEPEQQPWPAVLSETPAAPPASAVPPASTAPPTRRARSGPGRGGPGRRGPGRSPVRRILSLAAAVVALAVLTAVAFGIAVRTGRTGGGQPEARPTSPGAQTSQPWDPIWPGFPDGQSPQGERFATTDTASGVRLEVFLDAKQWGTQLAISVGGITGPQNCQLVVTGRNGTTETIARWGVPPEGYGTKEHPDPLVVPGSTGMSRGDITKIELRSVGTNGTVKQLATIVP